MSIWVAVIVIGSALLHALWNIYGKSQQVNHEFFYWVSVFAGLVLTPVIIWVQWHLRFSPSMLMWCLATGVFQAMYMYGLAKAYKTNDIGVIYPIIRALPVILVMALSQLWSAQLPILVQCAMAMVVIFTAALAFIGKQSHVPSLGYIKWPLLAIIGTTGYSLVDQQAMQALNTSDLPIALTTLYYAGLQLWFAAFFLRFTIKKPQLTSANTVLMTAIMMVSTYGLILYAMTLVDNVSYIVALRQVSIPISVALGIMWLKEPMDYKRMILSVCIALNLGLLVLI